MDLKKIIHFNFFTRDFLLFGVGIILVLVRFILLNNISDPEILKQVGEKVSFSGNILQEPEVRDTSTRYVMSIDGSDSKILVVANHFPEFMYGDRIAVAVGAGGGIEGDRSQPWAAAQGTKE